MTKQETMELWGLCVDINGTKRRCTEETGNMPTVFFDFLGHCALIIVRVYEKGWKAFRDADKRFELHTDGNDPEFKEAVKYLGRLKERAERRRAR